MNMQFSWRGMTTGRAEDLKIRSSLVRRLGSELINFAAAARQS